MPAAVLVKPRTRSFSPKPHAGHGFIACATAGKLRHHRARVRDALARAQPPPAHGDETQDQVLEHGAVARHVRPGARRGDAAAGAREDARGKGDLRRREIGALADPLRRERLHRSAQRLEPDTFSAQNAASCSSSRRITRKNAARIAASHPGRGWRCSVARRAGLGAARIDHDELQAARERVGEEAARVALWNAARHRDERIHADEQRDARAREILERRHPHARAAPGRAPCRAGRSCSS
jgi:hypothetical protein